MKILSITTGGFRNLKKTKLELNSLVALLALNNYGKSNLIAAIDFGFGFIGQGTKFRALSMMRKKDVPLNKKVDEKNYFFEIECEDNSSRDYRFVKYGFELSWGSAGDKGGIVDEWLEARPSTSVKYTSFLSRGKGVYRVSKDTKSYRKINVDENALILELLAIMDDIDICDLAKGITNIRFEFFNNRKMTENLSREFRLLGEGISEYDRTNIPKLLYALEKNHPEKYTLFLEALYTLFPEFINIKLEEIKLNADRVIVMENGASYHTAGCDMDVRLSDSYFRMVITSEHLNQPVDVGMMSEGTLRIIWLLAVLFTAEYTGVELIAIEEPETSLHPSLMGNLLEVIDEVLGNTRLIMTSHSPLLVQYFKPAQLYLGLPNEFGFSLFKRVRHQKYNQLIKTARDMGMSPGEYMFYLMTKDSRSYANMLKIYLEDRDGV